MFKEKENKWTRERGFWEVNAGDLVTLATAAFFFILTIAGFYIFLFQPHIPGLSDLYAAPPPPPPADQKLHLAPGETEMKLFTAPPKKPPEPKK
jgi:hypothetical protein